jgi:hypothetical protein
MLFIHVKTQVQNAEIAPTIPMTGNPMKAKGTNQQASIGEGSITGPEPIFSIFFLCGSKDPSTDGFTTLFVASAVLACSRGRVSVDIAAGPVDVVTAASHW